MKVNGLLFLSSALIALFWSHVIVAEEAVDGEVHALPVLDSVYDKEKDLEGEVHALPVYDKEKDLEGEVHALPIKDGEVQPQLKICGWCASHAINETACVYQKVWGPPSESGNCADACCKTHDYCCGSGKNRASCNDAIVNCIQGNGCIKSVCGAVVWTAMKTIHNWCCGSKCPTAMMAEIEQRLNITFLQ